MINPFLVILLVVTTIGGTIATLIEQGRLPEKRKRFEKRETKTLKEIFENYYANLNFDESEFIKTWNEIASILKLDPQKLRPEDRFKDELSPVKGYFVEDELSDLEEYLRIKCQKKDISFKGEKIKTLDELIRILLD